MEYLDLDVKSLARKRSDGRTIAVQVKLCKTNWKCEERREQMLGEVLYSPTFTV